jgi:hypothetical protein
MREITMKAREREKKRPAESAVELPVRLSPAAATSSVSYYIFIERKRARERARARDLGCQCLSSLSSEALYQLDRQYVYSCTSKASNIRRRTCSPPEPSSSKI